MYAVIFRAELNTVDNEYFETASSLRELAISRYGCVDFTSATEGKTEIAVSYWNSREDIGAWKEDKEHKKAQASGKAKWYKSYKVQVVEILREYRESN
jgi:heme-degrading monooxygenase HmoA